VVDPRRKLPDLNCEVQDLLLEVVDLKVPDLRSGGIPLNLTHGNRCPGDVQGIIIMCVLYCAQNNKICGQRVTDDCTGDCKVNGVATTGRDK